jgi:hypothetical protein
MLGMITGFWVSQIVGTLASLGIPDVLSAEPKTASAVAAQLRAPPESIFRLLRAAASVGVLRQEGQGFGLTDLGNTLRSDVLGSLRGMAIAQTAPGHWLPWGKLRDAVLTHQRQTVSTLGKEIFDYYRTEPEEGAAFLGAMQGLSVLVASEVVRLAPLSQASVVVDIGGATGNLLTAILQAEPRLAGILLDLPHVVQPAQRALREAGVGDRCEVVGGDFFREVPSGDLLLLKLILHDWSDMQCVTLLKHCARAMGKTGRLLVVENVIPDDGRPSRAQLMDINMLVMLPGRERTLAEFEALFAQAGLRLDKATETATPFHVLEVRPA